MYRIHEYQEIQSHTDLQEHVVLGLETCIASAFGGGITREDARAHMVGDQVLVANAEAASDDVYVVKGFSSTSMASPAELFGRDDLRTERGAYFAGAAICSTAQGTGLYHTLNTQRLDFAFMREAQFVFTRTQNPRVQEGITSSFERLVDEGELVAYSMSRLVVPGAYPGMLTTTKPVGRRITYDDLDYDRGDAAIIIWDFERPSTVAIGA